jgi:exosortase H (IPTLxxWG-CTERM-specific)
MTSNTDIQRTIDVASPWKIFAFRFLILSTLGFALLELAPQASYHTLNRFNTILTARLMYLGGIRPLVNDTGLTLDGFTVNVIGECSALFLLALLSAFILAYPTTGRQKLFGLLTCIPLVMAVNIFRIALVFYVGSQYRHLFKPLHLYFGQVLMIAVVLAVVKIWLRRLSAETKTRSYLVFPLRFIVFTSPLFLIWLGIAPAYLDLATAVAFYLLKGLDLLTITQPSWASDPSIPITFNLVLFCGLILASRPQPWAQKILGMAVGTMALVAGHLLLKTGHLLFLQHHNAWLMRALNAWLLINQWILPLGAWMVWRTQSRRPANIELRQKITQS